MVSPIPATARRAAVRDQTAHLGPPGARPENSYCFLSLTRAHGPTQSSGRQVRQPVLGTLPLPASFLPLLHTQTQVRMPSSVSVGTTSSEGDGDMDMSTRLLPGLLPCLLQWPLHPYSLSHPVNSGQNLPEFWSPLLNWKAAQ